MGSGLAWPQPPLTRLSGTMPTLLPIALLLALAPAVYLWWSGRSILRRPDDPALPELLLARRKRVSTVTTTAAVLLAVAFGTYWLFTVPLFLLGLLVSGYFLRRALFGEQWSLSAYLRYAIFSVIGGAGFWLLALLTPVVVLAIVEGWIPQYEPMAAVRVAGLLGAVLGAALLLWARHFPRVWLRLHQATPLADSARSDLMPRLDAIMDRCGTSLPRRPAIYRFGAPGGYIMNALALPSLHAPAVAFGDTLLATLSDDEIGAVFAHEIAHHEQYTPRLLRRLRWSSWILVLLCASMPPLLAGTPPGTRWLFAWLLGPAALLALGKRAAKSRERETESDLRAVALTGNPTALASALQKLHVFSRVPRRWPHDLERAATHPSLARRIQDILAASGGHTAPSLGGHTFIESARPGLVIVLDDVRAHWFEGVPEGTARDLAALRERAASYRACAYSELTELRVMVSGADRDLLAADRHGQRWTAPLRPADVEPVQRALDIVDVRLGRRTAAPRLLATLPARLLAVALVYALAMGGELGVVLLPAILVLVRPTTAAIAATGAMALVRSLVALANGQANGTLQTIGLIAAAVAAAALCVIAVMRSHAARRLNRRRAEARADEWPAARLCVVVLGAAAVVALIPVVPAFIASPFGAVDHPLAFAFTALMLGLGAAVATIPKRRWTVVGTAAAFAAAIGTTLIAGEGWLYNRLAPLTWTSKPAIAVDSIAIAGNVVRLELSPAAGSYAVQRLLASADRENGNSRFIVGTFRHGTVAARQRSIDAVAMTFLAENEALVLTGAGSDSLELRVERTAPAAVTGIEIAWRKRFGAVFAPQLFVDRARRAWTVAGSDGDDETLVVFRGVVGSDSVAMQRSTRASAIGRPLVAFADGSTMFLALHQMGESPAGGTWLAALGGMSMSWEVQRMRGGSRDVIGRVRGYLTCDPALSNDVAQCMERGSRRTRLLRTAADGTIQPLASLPTSFDVFRADGARGLTIASRGAARVVTIDTAARQATEAMLPASLAVEPRRWLVDVASAGGYVATLTSAVGSGHLTLLRLQ